MPGIFRLIFEGGILLSSVFKITLCLLILPLIADAFLWLYDYIKKPSLDCVGPLDRRCGDCRHGLWDYHFSKGHWPRLSIIMHWKFKINYSCTSNIIVNFMPGSEWWRFFENTYVFWTRRPNSCDSARPGRHHVTRTLQKFRVNSIHFVSTYTYAFKPIVILIHYNIF